MTNYYQIYGLNLTANVDLPGPANVSTPQIGISSIKVMLGHLPAWLTQLPQDLGISPNWYTYPKQSDDEEVFHSLQVWQVNQAQYFYCLYQDGTTFVLNRQGTQIWATWPDDLTLEDTATYLLGPILGFVLRLRGTVCLHASAIAVNGQAIAFMGAAGAGKSTTAAALAQRDYPVLAEDVVALVDQGDTFLVQPAYPRIRLWDTSVSALYGAADALPRIVPTHPTWDKRYLDLTQPGYQFQQEPLPLAAVYYLNVRSDSPICPCIEAMPAQDQLITLVTNTYTNYLLDKQQRAHEFEVLSRLVKHVPIRQITPHTDVACLPQLLDVVLEDFQTISPSHPQPAHA
jgi:hypothetical protein